MVNLVKISYKLGMLKCNPDFIVTFSGGLQRLLKIGWASWINDSLYSDLAVFFSFFNDLKKSLVTNKLYDCEEKHMEQISVKLTSLNIQMSVWWQHKGRYACIFRYSDMYLLSSCIYTGAHIFTSSQPNGMLAVLIWLVFYAKLAEVICAPAQNSAADQDSARVPAPRGQDKDWSTWCVFIWSQDACTTWGWVTQIMGIYDMFGRCCAYMCEKVTVLVCAWKYSWACPGDCVQGNMCTLTTRNHSVTVSNLKRYMSRWACG